MNRRYVLKGIGVVALYSSFPAVLSEFISSCKAGEKKLRAGFFSDDEFHLLEHLADSMMPATSTPGALEAQVPYFIELVVKNCLNETDQQMVMKGLKQLNDQPNGKFSSFSEEEKLNAVKKIDDAAFKDDPDKTWFRIIKKLSLIGYFTSRDGMIKALKYVKVPGEYKACVPYKKGEKALAKTFLIYW